MRVAIIGRTSVLLDAARNLAAKGHDLPVVWTCRAEPYYDAKESDFERFANDIGADFVNDLRIHGSTNLARLARHQCDIAISVNWLSILKPSVLDLFPLGILNAHAGDLPRYRGNACPNWAILDGESHVGLCIHRMVEELDAGPVIIRDRFPIGEDTYIGEFYDWLSRRTPTMIAEAVEGLNDGVLTPEPQPRDPGLALRCFPRRPEDGRIDWSWPQDKVLRLIRASSRPFSGAHCFLESESKLTVWRASRYRYPFPYLAMAGQICHREGSDPVVACADGMIRLEDIELEGVPSQEGAKQRVNRSLRHRLS